MANNYQAGNVRMICDICGFEYRRSEMRLDWKNRMVCQKDWSPKHPQLNVRGVVSRSGVPNARPDPEPVYVDADNPITADDL